MSMKYLGERFDIHTGGTDLRFPHHEDEIAQSEGAVGHEVVSIWVHAGHLRQSGQKIAKSTGNVVLVRGPGRARVRPARFRWLCFQTQYRSEMDFTWEAMAHADQRVKQLRRRMAEWAPARERARRRRDGVRRPLPRGARGRPGHARRAVVIVNELVSSNEVGRRREVRAAGVLGLRPRARSRARRDGRMGAHRGDARPRWPSATPPAPRRTSPRRTDPRRARRDGPRGDGHRRGHEGPAPRLIRQSTTQQLARRPVERFDAIVRHGHDVLDPHAEPAVEVDPGLDAERHAGLEHRRVLVLGVRRLVHLESDAVPGPMEEPLAVPGGLDHRSRGPVDLADRDPGAHDGSRGRLRLLRRRRGPRPAADRAPRPRPSGSCRCSTRRARRRSRARPHRRARSSRAVGS